MFSFFEIVTGNFIKPHLEFETYLKLEPSLLIDSSLFTVVHHKSGVDLYIPQASSSSKKDQRPKIFRFTPDFKFKITLESAILPPEKISVYSASDQYFNHLNQLLPLEPTFKFKPLLNMDSNLIKSILLKSSCSIGYIEISSWRIENPIFEELFITSIDQLDLIDFTNIKNIERIALYDIEKNKMMVQLQNGRKADSKNSQLSLFHSDDIKPQVNSEAVSENLNTNEADILRNMLMNYFSKNFSQSAANGLLKNTIGKPIPELIQYLDSFIKKIKFNQKEHAEKIKAIVADFYTEHYKQISEQNFTQAIEEFYTNN